MKKAIETCYCRNCGSPNVQVLAWVDANTSEWICDANDPLMPEDTWCDDCEERAGFSCLRDLWVEFQSVPISEDGYLEKDFLWFQADTPKATVLEWFAERCPNSIEKDLSKFVK